MDLASVVAALASVGVRVSGSTPNSNIQEDSSRACPTGLAGPEPSGTHNDPGQHFQEPDADELAEPAPRFDTEPAVEPEDLEPLPSDTTTVEPEDLGLEPVPSDEIMTEDSHQPDMHLDDAGNEPDMPADTDDLPV